MATERRPLPWLIPIRGVAGAAAADPDDDIHVVSMTPVDRFYGPALLVVVTWLEDGKWVERELELPCQDGDEAAERTPGPSSADGTVHPVDRADHVAVVRRRVGHGR